MSNSFLCLELNIIGKELFNSKHAGNAFLAIRLPIYFMHEKLSSSGFNVHSSGQDQLSAKNESQRMKFKN